MALMNDEPFEATEAKMASLGSTQGQSVREKSFGQSLEAELRQLESSLSPEALNLYQRYRWELPTTSEKIYFLRLRGPSERNAYLRSKGLLRQGPFDRYHALTSQNQRSLAAGMSRDQVLQQWGLPNAREVAGQDIFGNERWIYQTDAGTRYIYFERGNVATWKDSY